MKKLFFLSLTILSLVTLAHAQEEAKNGPILAFAEKSHDFGDISQGTKVEWIFKFKNTGTQPLVISDVVTTCSCTAKEYSKEPVLPGKLGKIVITFDSSGKQGIQNKVITVISNAVNSTERVSIRMNVLKQ